jgi:hypothetical protein
MAMSRNQNPLLILCILCALLTVVSLVPVAVRADRCSELQEKGLLLSQQFKKNEVCKESKIVRGWTDCLFRVGNTEILIVGAMGRNIKKRMPGFSGSGFYINSVDSNVNLRIIKDADLGLPISVTAKDALMETGCFSNRAYITLDARVLDSRELNKIKLGAMDKPEEEGTKGRIMDLQEDLAYLGYKPGPIDGVLGPQTRAAVEAYKRDKGINPNMTDDEAFSLIGTEVLMKRHKELDALFQEKQRPEPPLK